jgi:hypothetical protein
LFCDDDSDELALSAPERVRLSPEALGDRLFDSLFKGEVLGLYEQSVVLSEAEGGAGLRIELMLDPRDPKLLAVQAPLGAASPSTPDSGTR